MPDSPTSAPNGTDQEMVSVISSVHTVTPTGNRTRRRGNPSMTRGGPSLNPFGRPRISQSLADALRRRFPVERIVELASAIVADPGTPGRIKLATLEWIGRRGYGLLPMPASPPHEQEDAA
jgi:hypothetical protein